MTTHEAYSLGWVYGALERAIEAKKGINAFDRTGEKFEQAAAHPISGFALIHQSAVSAQAISPELSFAISTATAGISPACEERPEPLENQGSWQLGYYLGKSGKPLPSTTFDIAARRRAHGLTQAQLGEKIGVAQALISRWESGETQPNEESMQKLLNAIG